MDTKIALLRKIALFSELNDQELALIDQVIVRLNYKKREPSLWRVSRG